MTRWRKFLYETYLPTPTDLRTSLRNMWRSIGKGVLNKTIDVKVQALLCLNFDVNRFVKYSFSYGTSHIVNLYYVWRYIQIWNNPGDKLVSVIPVWTCDERAWFEKFHSYETLTSTSWYHLLSFCWLRKPWTDLNCFQNFQGRILCLKCIWNSFKRVLQHV